MDMNFLWISPYYPPNFQTFIEKLSLSGIRVLGIGEEPYDQLGELLQRHLTEYYRVENLEDYQEVIRGVAFLIYKYGPIDRVESNNEHWLTLDAGLREQFNITGLMPVDLKKTKYKSEMKRLFKECGAPIVEGVRIERLDEIQKAIDTIGGLPVIAKPDLGVGSSATYKLETRHDVDQFSATWKGQTPYFIEEFVTGELCTYDGLLDQNGDIVFEASFTHDVPTLNIVHDKTHMYIVIDRDVDPSLKTIGRRIVRTFGMKERFFHIEFFRTPDGQYITLEYNNRLTGGFVIDAYNHLYSHDLFQHYASVVKGETFDNPMFKKRLGVVVTRRHQFLYKHSLEDIRNHFGEDFRASAPIKGILAEMQGDEWMLITCDDKTKVAAIVDYIHEINR